MKIVDIEYAKQHLEELVEEAAQGASFVIAKDGKPLVEVSSIDKARTPRSMGFMAGEIKVPEDFDTMFSAEIEAMFEGRD